MAKRMLLLLAGLSLTGLPGCDLLECPKSEVPPFEIRLHASGSVVTSRGGASGVPVLVDFRKRHCSGSLSGTMRYSYVSGEYGRLQKQGIGTWSINVSNEKDEVVFDVLVNDSPHVKGSGTLGYSALEWCKRRGSITIELLISCNPDFTSCKTTFNSPCG